jgi:hypothetical protein
MRKLLIAAIAGIVAPYILAVAPAAHADCYKLPADLVRMCLGDQTQIDQATTTQTVPTWNPCFSTGVNSQDQECKN